MQAQDSPTARLGIDFGGTSVKLGRIDDSGNILGTTSVPMELERGKDAVFDAVASAALALGASPSVGVGIAGLIDRERGVLLESPNLKALEGHSITAELARRMERPLESIALENDANVAALGEQWAGAGQGRPDVCTITLGTGIGGGFVLGGQLYIGPGGMAAEAGHLVVDPTGPPCPCGQRGCLERLASATAARERARRAGLSEDLEALCASARQSPGAERTLLEAIGRDLGRGLGAIVTLLDLRLFVVGGGFGAALDVLRPGVCEGLKERTFGPRLDEIELVPAILGGDAGWIGAARLLA